MYNLVKMAVGVAGMQKAKKEKKENRKKKKRKKKEKRKSMQETSHFAAGPQYTLECKWSERKLKINERAKIVVRERQTSQIFKINY